MLVQLGAEGHVDLTLVYYGACLSALVIGMHIALRFVAPQADPFLLPIATVLTGIGIAEIYRIDIHYKVTGWESDGIKQIVWAAIAIVCAIAVIIVCVMKPPSRSGVGATIGEAGGGWEDGPACISPRATIDGAGHERGCRALPRARQPLAWSAAGSSSPGDHAYRCSYGRSR